MKKTKIKYSKSFLDHAKKHKLDAEEMEQLWLYEQALAEKLEVEPKKEKQLRKLVADAAENHFAKTARTNIRISEYDLKQVKYRAMREGLPYQTLLSSIIHKYVQQPYQP